MFVSENNNSNKGSTNQLQGSTSQLQSSNSLENAGRHSSVDNHVESAASASATASGIANMQGKIQQLENDLRERGEQILQLRRDNRKVQARVDESNDALGMAQATHEKLQREEGVFLISRWLLISFLKFLKIFWFCEISSVFIFSW